MKIITVDQSTAMADCCLAAGYEAECCTDEVKALHVVESMQPALILVNHAVRGMETPDYLQMLLDSAPNASIVVVGQSLSDESVVQCLLVGAKGYLDLYQLPLYLPKLVDVLMRGEAWVSRKLVSRLLDAIRMMTAETQAV
ncbi:hypothetical protein [Methylomonas sp. HYX-M1]|uniref:hypothetical protein n=1 Tax=Methylomonas sp. HYX-M1 TaxID=3139307 RepID=UPI00345B9608